MPASTFVALLPEYNAPRSYVYALNVEFDGAFNFIQAANEIHCDYPGGGHLKIVVRTAFYNWNSNYYSSAYIFDDQASENTYPPFYVPVGFFAFVTYRHVDNFLVATMRVQFTAGAPHLFSLPPAPSTYWDKHPPL